MSESTTDQSSREQEREALEKALDFIADHEDVIDGDNGPLPNRAMVLAAELRAVIAKAATLPPIAITAEEAGREGIEAELKEGAAEEILRTYLALHKGKLGAHWMWCAIEQLVAGIPEAEVMSDYGYFSTPPSALLVDKSANLQGSSVDKSTEMQGQSAPGNGEAEGEDAPSEKQRKLMELADRIDYERLCLRPGMTHRDMTPEQRCRMNAGVELRRYAKIWKADRWIVIPPTGPVRFSALTLDKAYEMAKTHEARNLPPAPAQSGGQG